MQSRLRQIVRYHGARVAPSRFGETTLASAPTFLFWQSTASAFRRTRWLLMFMSLRRRLPVALRGTAKLHQSPMSAVPRPNDPYGSRCAGTGAQRHFVLHHSHIRYQMFRDFQSSETVRQRTEIVSLSQFSEQKYLRHASQCE